MPMKVRFRSTRLKTSVVSLSPYVTFDKLLLWAMKTADDLCKVSAMLHIASYAKEENALAGKFILWLFLISSLLSSTAVWKQKDSMIKHMVSAFSYEHKIHVIFCYTSYRKCHSLTDRPSSINGNILTWLRCFRDKFISLYPVLVSLKDKINFKKFTILTRTSRCHVRILIHRRRLIKARPANVNGFLLVVDQNHRGLKE